jgi:phage terminase small subunit
MALKGIASMVMPRKSLDLHVVQSGGKPRKDVRDRESITPRSAPIKGIPRRMNADQKAVWRDLARSLPAGLVRLSDAVRFEELVIAVCAERQLLEAFNADGAQVYVKPRGRRKGGISPIWRELSALSARVRVLCSEFGMTPLARAHVQLPPPPAPANPLARFLTPK